MTRGWHQPGHRAYRRRTCVPASRSSPPPRDLIRDYLLQRVEQSESHL